MVLPDPFDHGDQQVDGVAEEPHLGRFAGPFRERRADERHESVQCRARVVGLGDVQERARHLAMDPADAMGELLEPVVDQRLARVDPEHGERRLDPVPPAVVLHARCVVVLGDQTSKAARDPADGVRHESTEVRRVLVARELQRHELPRIVSVLTQDDLVDRVERVVEAGELVWGAAVVELLVAPVQDLARVRVAAEEHVQAVLLDALSEAVGGVAPARAFAPESPARLVDRHVVLVGAGARRQLEGGGKGGGASADDPHGFLHDRPSLHVRPRERKLR